MATHIWPDTARGKYIVQTSNPGLYHKLKKRKNAVLVGSGVNCHLWLYKIGCASLNDAKKTLKKMSQDLPKSI